jgi:hypothetical protein
MVLVLLDGRIAHMGTYQQLMSSGVDLSAFVPPPHAGEEGEGEDSNQAEGLTVSDTADAQQQQQQQSAASSLLAADSQQLGNRLASSEVLSSALERRQQQQQALQSGDSSAQLVQLPSFYTKSLLAAGGSFASHVPLTLDADAGQGGGARAVNGAATEAAPAAAAAAAAAAGGSMAPSAGEAVNIAVDATQPLGDVPEQQGLGVTFDWQGLTGSAISAATEAADESAPLIGAAEAAKSTNQQQQQQWQDPFGSSSGSSGSRQRGQLVLAEQRAKGQVKRSVYLAYLTAMGPLLAVPIAVLIGG